jgi:predicted TIM-barrel fold metal-dependent hydrolase
MAKNGFKIIDAELHVMEPADLWEKYIDPEFKDRAPRRLTERDWDIRTVVEGDVMASMSDYNWPARSNEEATALATRYAAEIAVNFSPESQVKAMDNEGLDLAVLYPTAGMFITARNGMDPRFAEAACRAYNNWLYDYIQAADPTRMFGAAALSPHDVDTAVTEAKRCVKDLGFKAVFLRPNMYNNRSWHDPYYDPLWATVQDLDVAVGFHETTGSRMPAAGADRFPDDLGIAHIATHSIEQMMVCMDVIMGGVMERFPKLQFAFLEGQCGWLPFWLGRMDEHFEWRHPYGEMQDLKMKPSEYFNRQGYAAVECEESFVSHVIEAVGGERLLTTSDYPHGDAKYPHTIDTFLKLPLSDESKRQILWDNPARLYKL